MLVMSRREGEVILIGEDIEILIAQIGRSRVKVGIRAPRHMPVVAREVKLVCEENLAAAAGLSGRGFHPPEKTSTQLFKFHTNGSIRFVSGKKPAQKTKGIQKWHSQFKLT